MEEGKLKYVVVKLDIERGGIFFYMEEEKEIALGFRDTLKASLGRWRILGWIIFTFFLCWGDWICWVE